MHRTQMTHVGNRERQLNWEFEMNLEQTEGVYESLSGFKPAGHGSLNSDRVIPEL
jgi:hypothetical protein